MMGFVVKRSQNLGYPADLGFVSDDVCKMNETHSWNTSIPGPDDSGTGPLVGDSNSQCSMVRIISPSAPNALMANV